jgi:hypothetical protein
MSPVYRSRWRTRWECIDIIDPEADIRPNAKKKWFDPQTALRALEKRDIGLLIADGYSIFWTVGKQKPLFVGKLSADRSALKTASLPCSCGMRAAQSMTRSPKNI